MVNAAYLRAIGKEERDVIGRTSLELNAEPEAARAKVEHDRTVIESGRSLTSEEVFPGAAAGRTFLTTKSPLRDEHGRIVGLVGVATDITDRKLAERERESLIGTEQRLRARGRAREPRARTSSSPSCRTSCARRSTRSAAGGSCSASARPLEPGLVERATQAIKRNVDHQARLIDDILDTSRIMSGKLTIERRPVNLVEVVHAAVEIVRPAAGGEAHRAARRRSTDPVITARGRCGAAAAGRS